MSADKMQDSSTGRRYWARQLIDKAQEPIPSYGSWDWSILPSDDPSRIAAVVISAECWATSADNMEADLRREIEASQVAFKAGEDAAYQESAAAHREKWDKPSTVKSFTARRAAQLAAVQPRPDDYLGGDLA